MQITTPAWSSSADERLAYRVRGGGGGGGGSGGSLPRRQSSRTRSSPPAEEADAELSSTEPSNIATQPEPREHDGQMEEIEDGQRLMDIDQPGPPDNPSARLYGAEGVVAPPRPPSIADGDSDDSSDAESDEREYFLSPSLGVAVMDASAIPIPPSSSAKVLQPTMNLLRKSQQDLQRELFTLDQQIASTNAQVRAELMRLLEEEIQLLQADKHPKIVRKAEKAQAKLKRQLKVSERRRAYQVTSVMNAYDCLKQQIDMDYQAALRELKSQHELAPAVDLSSTGRATPLSFPPSPTESALSNAGVEDLQEIERQIGAHDRPDEPVPVASDNVAMMDS